MTSLVVTIVGPDRSGIVGEISEAIANQGGSWLESQMANLAGQFAGIIRLDVADANVQATIDSLEALETTGLKVVVERAGAVAVTGRRMVSLEIIGNDRPGIVRDISGVLSDLGVSIEEFESDSVSRSASGDLLFKARAQLSLPAALATDELNDRIHDIANDIMVDILLEDDASA